VPLRRLQLSLLLPPLITINKSDLLVMPTIGVTDPADLELKACVDLGFSWRLEQTHQISPPPSLGGSGYALWYHQ
jgi:hypothetical protein